MSWHTGTVLGILSVLLLLARAGSGFVVMGAFFIFDAPGTTEIAAAWTLCWGMLGLPVVLLATIVLSWVLFFFKQGGAALLSTLLPLLYIGVLAVIYQLQGGMGR